MPIEYQTLAGVPIVSTGEYTLASGKTTFSAEDLAAAVNAASDPTVPAPRIKLGHIDDRFAEDLDGEPAFGRVTAMRLSDDGQTILGDLTDVPSWLAESMPSAFPGRSIEGGKNFRAPSGRDYDMVISNLALLGTVWPGVTSLADLSEVLSQNGPVLEPIAAANGGFEARLARPGDDTPTSTGDIMAGLDLGNVREQFCGDVDSGEVPQVPDDQPQADDVGSQMWWWPRSVRVEDDGTLCLIVDDDAGHLIQIPFTVTQGDLIYGTPKLVIEQYVPVTSDPDEGQPVTARGPRILASWPVRAANRPSNPTEAVMTKVDYADLRKRLGLPEDADEATIIKALAAKPIAVDPKTVTPATPTTPQTVPVATPTAIPEGSVVVDEATLTELREGVAQGVAVAARLAKQDRDEVINAAIGQGRFPVSRRDHYATAWDRDPDGTRHLLTASAADGGLAPGMVPVSAQEVGRAGDGDGDPSNVEREHQEFMARYFPNQTRRQPVRIRTEA